MKTDLTDEQLRIAIAKWCGWSWGRINYGPHEGRYSHKDPEGNLVKDYPNYPEDLNAMHEAECKLSIGESVKYEINLDDILLIECRETGFVRPEWNATARQRALALYLTIKQKDV